MHDYNSAICRHRIQKDTDDRVNKIRLEVMTHVNTSLLDIRSLPDPYHFVMEYYPQVADLIREIKIYKNDNTALWRRLGLSGAAGLYIRPLSMVLIMYSPTVPDDVVAVHELIHCANDKLHLAANDQFAQETMTFRASIPYLAKKHKSDWIVKNYLYPFYSGFYAASRRKDPSADALHKAWQIVHEETGEKPNEDPTPDALPDRFDFID